MALILMSRKQKRKRQTGHVFGCPKFVLRMRKLKKGAGVGANLQDHLEVYLVQQCTKPVSLYSQQRGLTMVKVGLQWFLNQTGDGATTHLESGAFLRSRPEVTKDITSLFLYMAGCPSRYTDSFLPCSSNRSREDSTKNRGFPGSLL